MELGRHIHNTILKRRQKMAFSYHAPKHIDGNYSTFPKDMAEWEKKEIEANPSRGHELMEIAGREVANHVLMHYPTCREILVFCGLGNNGGDGFAAARYLKRCGLDVHLFVFDESISKSADAKSMFERVQQLPRIVLHTPSDAARILEWEKRRGVLVIDGIFGTGYHPSHNPLMSRIYQCITKLSCPVVSIDIPSGIDAATGYRSALNDENPPKALAATSTVTFSSPKMGHFFGEGPTHTGDLWCVDIGLNPWPSDRTQALILSDEYCQTAFWQHFTRSFDVHKGKCGHVAVIGGQKCMRGASCLAGRAALRAGCGLVTLGTRCDIQAPDELMVRPICSENGHLNQAVLDEIFQKADCILVGPGLGRDELAIEILSKCLNFNGRLVLDADALWALPNLNMRFKSQEVFVTPHPAEAARLCGVTAPEILFDPIGYAKIIVEKYGVTAILKSHAAVVASQRGNVMRYAVCPHPNPAIATAGAGDVLAGILSGILSETRCGAVTKWFDAFESASMAVNCHSKAGRNAANTRGNAVCAGDIIDNIDIG